MLEALFMDKSLCYYETHEVHIVTNDRFKD